MEAFLFAIEVIGIISFTISGALVAIDKETDAFGVIFLSFVTCFCGGIIRDVILGIHLPRVFTSMTVQVICCLVTSIVVFCIAKAFNKKYIENEELVCAINNYVDALALSIFAVGGVHVYLETPVEHNVYVAMVMGMISAVGGSITRDVILRDIPFVLRKRIYALAAILGSGVYYMFTVEIFPGNDVAEVITTIVTIFLVFTLRVLATKFKWNMPKAIKFSEIKAEQDTEK